MALESLKLDPTLAPRSLSVFGATGSVGASTLDLVRRNPNLFSVDTLTAHRSVGDLAEQARAVHAKLAVIGDPDCYADLKAALAGSGIEVAAGPDALNDAAHRPCDFVMAAIVGAAGLPPTLEAIKQGRVIGLANKETLVCGGEFVTEAVRRHGAQLLPVDSEHNAIFQVLEEDRREALDRIVLTASGGPFRTWTTEAMAKVTPEQALAHPNWDMGAKISIDSATMMNKGLELIEACHLFALDQERVDILVHPQSVIHSMVAYNDGSVLAQLGEPDMRIPIAYALAWPKRMTTPVPALDLAKIGRLDFEEPDPDRFPALRLSREALRIGDAGPTILNAANEVAVSAFLAGKIEFLSIISLVERCMKQLSGIKPGNLSDLLQLDQEARRLCEEKISTGRE